MKIANWQNTSKKKKKKRNNYNIIKNKYNDIKIKNPPTK